MISIITLTVGSIGFGYWLGTKNQVANAGEISQASFEELLDELTERELGTRDSYLDARNRVLYNLDLKINYATQEISKERDEIYKTRLEEKLND